MRIGLNRSDAQLISDDVTATSRGNATKSKSVENGDNFSEDTVSISNLVAQALQTPDVRQSKTERLQQSVWTGEYRIDPSAIAEAMRSK